MWDDNAFIQATEFWVRLISLSVILIVGCRAMYKNMGVYPETVIAFLSGMVALLITFGYFLFEKTEYSGHETAGVQAAYSALVCAVSLLFYAIRKRVPWERRIKKPNTQEMSHIGKL